jgi:hypothetical protein
VNLNLSEKAMKELSRSAKVNRKKAEAEARKKAEAEARAEAQKKKQLLKELLRAEKKAALARAKECDELLRDLVVTVEESETSRRALKDNIERNNSRVVELGHQIEAAEERLGKKREEMATLVSQISNDSVSIGNLMLDRTRVESLLTQTNEAWLDCQPAVRKKERDRRVKKSAESLISKQV